MSTLLALDLRAPSALPLTKRLVGSIVREIQRGALAPGAELPSSRELSRSLGIHRNTALAAYRELIAQGYLETVQARGTFVSRKIAATDAPPGAPCAAPLAIELPPLELGPLGRVRAGELPLLGGLPDLREFPSAELYRAYRAALRGTRDLLDYGDAQGHIRLRRELAAHLRNQRGVAAHEARLLVTRGSQQALFLAARALVGKRGVVAVEQAGYPPAWDAFRVAGAELVPIPIDKDGLVVSALARLAKKRKIAAVYTTPHHQYPTTVTLSGPRRLELLELAARERFVIIEDDYDHEFHFEGNPVFPLAQKDEHGVVLHVATLSKVFAPGLRIGYAHGPEALIERMTALRAVIDRQGDAALELALSSLMEEGEFGAHVRRMFRTYTARRTVFFECLARELGDVVEFEPAPGGLAVWARAAAEIDVAEWARRAKERKVLFQEGAQFYFDRAGGQNHARFGFARLNEAEIEAAFRALRLALPKSGFCSPPSAKPSRERTRPSALKRGIAKKRDL